jgi:hypothetical protein
MRYCSNALPSLFHLEAKGLMAMTKTMQLVKRYQLNAAKLDAMQRYTWLEWGNPVQYCAYDRWTNTVKGRYLTKSKAQARARVLNSRAS